MANIDIEASISTPAGTQSYTAYNFTPHFEGRERARLGPRGPLVESGLVTVTPAGNQKHYQANPASPVFAELHGLVVKTIGLAGPLEEALAPFRDRIDAAFVYGSIAKLRR